MQQKLDEDMRSNDFFFLRWEILQHVRADGNDSVEKENLMMHEREDKARVKSMNK